MRSQPVLRNRRQSRFLAEKHTHILPLCLIGVEYFDELLQVKNSRTIYDDELINVESIQQPQQCEPV